MTAPRRLVREYLRLGLRLGRHIDGFVDCWFGDPATAARIAAEPPADPAGLAATARRLLAELPDTELDEDPGRSGSRSRFLAAQLRALECTASRLAGVAVPFQAEVRAYFDTEIEPGDPERYALAHRELGRLLPGSGPLPGRLAAFAERNRVPADRLAPAVRTVSEALRDRTRAVFGLPAGEAVGYQVVCDEPWNAFNTYHGGYRSTVALNAEAGGALGALPILVTHESYPGHHTEHCVKEAGLVVEGGAREHVLALVNTPQCLLAEGAAELGLDAVLGPGWGRWTAERLAPEGVHIDGELLERVMVWYRRLLPARQDAAILLHDRGADADRATAYLQRWLLLPPDRAGHMVRFLTDPLWRAYTVTYIEGARLVGDWLAARPAGESVAARYRALLSRAVLPTDLRADVAAATTKGHYMS